MKHTRKISGDLTFNAISLYCNKCNKSIPLGNISISYNIDLDPLNYLDLNIDSTTIVKQSPYSKNTFIGAFCDTCLNEMVIIDTPLADCIVEMNSKHIFTTASCDGSDNSDVQTYLQFYDAEMLFAILAYLHPLSTVHKTEMDYVLSFMPLSDYDDIQIEIPISHVNGQYASKGEVYLKSYKGNDAAEFTKSVSLMTSDFVKFVELLSQYEDLSDAISSGKLYTNTTMSDEFCNRGISSFDAAIFAAERFHHYQEMPFIV